jgi:DNA-binding LytR/AlgR family response regulator
MLYYFFARRVYNLKISVYIDKNREEEIQIFAHNESELIEQIKSFVNESLSQINGFKGKEIFPLSLSEIYCFTVERNKVFALTRNDKFVIRERLYEIEKILSHDFIKINKSCIANITKIERFDASISGTLMVKLKNGYTDYVSRRSVKTVKERLGL